MSLWRPQSFGTFSASPCAACCKTKMFSAIWALEELMLELERGNTDTFDSVNLCKKFTADFYIHPCAEAQERESGKYLHSSNHRWSWPKSFPGNLQPPTGFRRAVPTALTSKTLMTAPQGSPSTPLLSPLTAP